MCHFSNLLRAILTALLLLVAGAAVAGPLEDALAARQRSDYATEYRLLRPLAEEGNAAAQNGLGIMYENGHGVEQDHAEAVKWYRRAADQGDAAAQFNLGLMYENGRGVQQDELRPRSGFAPPLNRVSRPRRTVSASCIKTATVCCRTSPTHTCGST
jgi:hypothetical protein